MGFDVIVLGSLHMDIMVSAPDRPRRGETLTGHAWSLKPGGKGGNQAVEAAAAGASTAMIGDVGADDFGRALLQNLDGQRIDRSHVGIRRDAGSGMSVAILDAGGDYGAVIVSGANLSLAESSAEAAQSLFLGARWLLLQNEVPDAANIGAARVARRHSVKTILNGAPSRPFPDLLKGLIDILVVNAIEAEAMGAPVVDSLATATGAATSLLGFAESTIVTAGGIGASLVTRDGRTVEIAGHVVDLVSTHGAGDCFIGSLAAQLSSGADLEEAVRYANAMAALYVSARAGSPGIDRQTALRDLLDDMQE
jgi:ribokinase